MESRRIALYVAIAAVAGVAGYVTINGLTNDTGQQLVASTAKSRNVDAKAFSEAVKLVDRVQSSQALVGRDRVAVDKLLASDEPTLRRYGIMAIQFGLGKTDPDEVEKVVSGFIGDHDERVRATAATTLYQVVPEHWGRYSKALAADPSKSVQSALKQVNVAIQTAAQNEGQTDDR